MTGLPLRALAPAKINLGLFIGPTRADGRHELVSVMQSISLADELTLEAAGEGHGADSADAGTAAAAGPATGEGSEAVDRIVCLGAPELEADNLAARALAAFRRDTGWDPGPLRLQIHKRVPIAAGMGGGSGDAAAALRLAARASGMGGSAALQELARELGADVPAQVAPGRWLAMGAGERLHQLPPAREPFGVLVLALALALSTAEVYAQADRLGGARSASELHDCAVALRQALADGQQLPPGELLVNDLQPAAISLCPQIAQALDRALGVGADVAMVSGSGPTVLGLFGGARAPERARQAVAELDERHPGAAAAVPVEAHFAQPRPVRNNGGIDRQARSA